MDDVKTQQRRIKADAEKLLESVGISRIVVVDDEYADSLADLLGICSELGSQNAEKLQHLDAVNFENTEEVWKHDVGEVWESLSQSERQSLLLQAQSLEASVKPQEFEKEASNPQEDESTDARAANCLEEVLGNLSNCEFITLSHAMWKEKSQSLLCDEKASETILLFDRNLFREGGSPDEGLKLLQKIPSTFTGYCGLITHTVSVGGEPEAWKSLSGEYRLDREKFVIISKGRLNSDPPDYFGFLGMLWLVAMSRRHILVRRQAWSIFENSVAQAKEAVEGLSPLDFDKIVFESSRKEGVAESDTLFRVFSILVRRAAQEQLRGDSSFREAVEDVRNVSAKSTSIVNSLRNTKFSEEAVRIQRFEMYESGSELNGVHAPLELGDVFENVSNGKLYVLLTQPCDLMVRNNGKRSYDNRLGRMGALVELVFNSEKTGSKWGKLEFFHADTDKSAYANFARAHQVQLLVLDLCVFSTDGEAKLDVDGQCPDLVIESWKSRHAHIVQRFRTALKDHQQLEEKDIGKSLSLLALPNLSTSIPIVPDVKSNRVHYGIKRVLRLRRPWSSALLTAYSHYMARAAFDPQFEQLDVS